MSILKILIYKVNSMCSKTDCMKMVSIHMVQCSSILLLKMPFFFYSYLLCSIFLSLLIFSSLLLLLQQRFLVSFSQFACLFFMEKVLNKAKIKRRKSSCSRSYMQSFILYKLSYTHLKILIIQILTSLLYVTNLNLCNNSIKHNKASHNFKAVHQTGGKPCLF